MLSSLSTVKVPKDRKHMIVYKANGLSKKDEALVFAMLQEMNDVYGDFYITQNNLRLYVKENFDIFKACLKSGDKLVYDNTGMAIVTGYSDKAPRKYLKLLVNDLESVPALVKAIYWHVNENLFCKVKNNNPIKDKLLRCGFKFIGGRGKESLLVHNYIARPEPKYTFSKDRDEDE